MSRAEFEYALKAKYEGASELKKLRADIAALGKIETMRKLAADSAALSRAFKAAKEELKAKAAAMREAGTATGKVADEYKKAKQNVQSLAAQIEKKNEALREASAEAKKLGLNTKQLYSENKRLNAVIEEEKTLLSARRALGIRSHKDVRAEIAALTRAYKDLKASGKLTTAELYQAKAKLQEKTSQLTASTRNWDAEIARVRGSLVALAAVGVAAIQSFNENANFQKGMAEVYTLVDITAERFAAFKKEVRETSKDFPQQTKDMTTALYDIISAGVELDGSTKVLAQSAKAATAGVTETGTAVKVGVGVMNAYGMNVEKIGWIYDILFQTVRKGVTTFPQLAEHMGEVLPTARAANVDLQTLGAAIAALTKAGIKTPIAATALKGALNAMSAPAPEAKKKFEELGITWQGLLPTIEAIKEKGLDLEQMRMLIPDTEARTAVLSLIQNFESFRDILGSMDSASGAMEKAYAKIAATPDHKVALFRKAIGDLAIGFGSLVSDGITPGIEKLTAMVNWIGDSSETTKTFLGILVGGGGALLAWNLGLGDVILGLKGYIMKSGISTVATFLFTTEVTRANLAAWRLSATTGAAGLASAMKVYAASAATAGKATFLMVWPLAAVAAGAVAVYAAFDHLLGIAKKNREAEMKASNSAAELAKKKFALSEKIRAVARDTGLAFDNIVELNKAITAGTVVWDEASKKWVRGSEQIRDAAEANAEKLPKLDETALKAMRTKWEEHVATVNRLQEQIVDRERKLSAELRELARKGMDEGDAWKNRKAEADEYAAAARKAFQEAQKALGGGDQAGAEKLFGEAVRFADQAKDAYKGLATSVGEAFDTTAEAAKKSAGVQEKVTRKAIEALQKKYEKYAAKVKSLQDEIAGREKSLAEQLREIARSGLDEKSAWEDRKKEAGEYAGKAEEAYQAAKRALSAGKGEQAESLFKQAVEYADAARAAYADLNQEVSDGDTVLISQQQAAEAAAKGVKETGELAISILKDQEAAAAKVAKTTASTYQTLATEYNATQQQALATATQGMESAGKLAVEVLRQQERAAQDAADALDKQAGGLFSEEALKKTKDGIEAVADGVKAVGDSWENTWDQAGKDFKGVAADIEKELDALTKDREVTITANVVEAKKSGGLVGSAVAYMAAGGSVAHQFAALGYRNLLSGGHLPGFGGGDRRRAMLEDGETVINKDATSEAGIDTSLAFNAKDWPLVIKNLTALMRRKYSLGLTGMIKAHTGGLISRFGNLTASLPQLPPVAHMSAGGLMMGGAGGGGETINVNLQLLPNARPVQVVTDRLNADELLRQVAQYQKYRS